MSPGTAAMTCVVARAVTAHLAQKRRPRVAELLEERSVGLEGRGEGRGGPDEAQAVVTNGLRRAAVGELGCVRVEADADEGACGRDASLELLEERHAKPRRRTTFRSEHVPEMASRVWNSVRVLRPAQAELRECGHRRISADSRPLLGRLVPQSARRSPRLAWARPL